MNTGWLDPQGKFYEAGYMDHFDVAYDIAEQLGLKQEPGENIDDTLLRYGYVRISMVTFIDHGIVLSCPYRRATEEFNGKIYEYNVPYISPQQREYLRKMYDTYRDIFASSGRYDLVELKIITQEEHQEWLKETDPDRYKKLYGEE